MRNNRTDIILLVISLCGFSFMSFSFVLMPFEGIGNLPGALFWGGLLFGCAFQIVLERRRRTFFRKYNVKREKMQKPRNGLLSFGSNKKARIADNAMVISLIVTVLTFIFTNGSGFLCFVFIATTIFFFCLHCILNGRIYFHAYNQTRIQHVLEQKKANSQDKGEGEK